MISRFYLGIFLKNSLTPEQANGVWWCSVFFSGALLISSLYCVRYVDHSLGWRFLWANTLLVVVSFYLYGQQYYFLAILMPRLVHDITAYSFYVSHDVNRHANAGDTAFYRWLSQLHVPVAVVLPLLSFLLTFLLQAYGDQLISLISQTLFATDVYKAVTLGLFGYLALMHYYTEAFVWAAGSPLRRYIRFSRIN